MENATKNKNIEIKQRLLYLRIQDHYRNVIKLLRKKVIDGSRLRVGFCVIFSSVFPAKPLFEAMLKDDLFEPFIIIAPDVCRGMEHMEETFSRTYSDLNDLYPGFVYKGYDSNTGVLLDISHNVDLLYFANPYEEMTAPVFQVTHFLNKNVLPFHINYTFFGTLTYDRYIMSLPAYNYYWRIFTESPLLNDLFETYQPLKGLNTLATGYCKMDALAKYKYQPKSRKKIIIAPHHTVEEGNKLLQLSNFLQYAELFQSLPKRYPQIDFILRPHPLLVTALKKPNVWGKRRTLEYFEQITNNSNLIHDSTGDYLELFASSDGIIHDCGSFLAEYLFTGKPAMYLIRSKEAIESTFDTIGQKCLENCYQGLSSEDIINFIESVIIAEEDPLQNTRDEFVTNTLKVNYPFASKTILRYLKQEFTK